MVTIASVAGCTEQCRHQQVIECIKCVCIIQESFQGYFFFKRAVIPEAPDDFQPVEKGGKNKIFVCIYIKSMLMREEGGGGGGGGGRGSFVFSMCSGFRASGWRRHQERSDFEAEEFLGCQT